MRTNQEIIDETNELARQLYALLGHYAPRGYRFEIPVNAAQRTAWKGACEAQQLLTGIDPEEVVNELMVEELSLA